MKTQLLLRLWSDNRRIPAPKAVLREAAFV
jgi:hypothetical protein